MVRLILIFFTIFTISGCSASYKKLKNTDINISDPFADSLVKIYKKHAIFEAEKMHDWNSAKLYSEKALDAVDGQKIKPQKIKYWNLPKDKISELQISYNNLMSIYEDAYILDPYNLAIAISSLDCWAEQQEENWQTWDIKKCKDDFLIAMHSLYEKISKNAEKKNKKNNESVSVVTTNEKKQIMQIIYFDFDKAQLSEISINTIKKFLDKNKNQINRYIIIGHADTMGTKNYNLQLSLKRANTVKDIFINEGIQEKNLKVLGKGESFLAVPTSDEIRHPANRRVEISTAN